MEPPRRITNAHIMDQLTALSKRLEAVEGKVDPIVTAWSQGRAGLKGAQWALSAVLFVLVLWWSGLIQKVLNFLNNHTPPGAV